MNTINITGEFVSDATFKTGTDPRNTIGCSVIADLTVWLSRKTPAKKATFGTPPIWRSNSFHPYNRIGRQIMDDQRRTKNIQTARVGRNFSSFITIQPR